MTLTIIRPSDRVVMLPGLGVSVQNIIAAPYMERLLRVASDGLIAYWPLDEREGSVVYDRSGNGRNGTYTACTLAQPGIGDGRPAPAFDGVSSRINAFSTGLASAFNGAEGTALAWARVASAAVWSDGQNRRVLQINSDSQNAIIFWLYPSTPDIQLRFAGSNVSRTRLMAVGSRLTWIPLALTWSQTSGLVTFYADGAAVGAPAAYPTWVGTPTVAYIGSTQYVYQLWSGSIAHVALWNRALSDAEITALSTL